MHAICQNGLWTEWTPKNGNENYSYYPLVAQSLIWLQHLDQQAQIIILYQMTMDQVMCWLVRIFILTLLTFLLRDFHCLNKYIKMY